MDVSVEEEENRAEPPGPSCPPMKSSSSPSRPPDLSGPGPSDTKGQNHRWRAEPPEPSCLSMKSDWSKDRPPDLSESGPSDTKALLCISSGHHYFSEMDLINWSFNAIDKIFSTMRTEEGAPTCPHGTHAVGYMLDSSKEWKDICLSQLSIEDVEDVWIFGLMITGFLVIGVGGYLVFR